MSVTLEGILHDMSFFRDATKLDPTVRILNLKTEGWIGVKQLVFRAQMQGKSQTSYLTYVMFNNVDFQDERDDAHDIPVEADGKVKYAAPPDLRKNTIRLKCSCFTGDTLIPLADGYSVPIKDLVGKKEFFVYSFDKETNKIAIGKGYNCGIKENNAEIWEVKLDNGNVIRCTGDHKFLLKDGSWVEAKDLKSGVSLEPLYRKLSDRNEFQKGYEQVYSNNEWILTHKLSDEYNLENLIYSQNEGKIRHHKDFNKLNNNPLNIQRLSWYKHHKIHGEALKNKNPMHDPEVVKRNVESRQSGDAWTNFKEDLKINNPMKDPKIVKKNLESRRESGKGLGGFRAKTKTQEFSQKMSNIVKERIAKLGYCKESLAKANAKVKELSSKGELYQQSSEFRENAKKLYKEGKSSLCKVNNQYFNHKVVSVKKTNIKEDVYCFTVEKYGNFVIDVDSGKDLSSGVVVANCADFRFRFAKELYDVGALIGNWQRYTPVPGSNRGPVNPEERLGVCKHIYSLLTNLERMDYIKE